MTFQKSSSLKDIAASSELRIAIVMSRFNENITRALLQGAKSGLREAGLKENQIKILEVPGAFEIPLLALSLAKSKKYDGIICLGTVIEGETPHFDYVCQGATQGVLQAQLETGIPMALGILTTHTVEQAMARAGQDKNNKGYEAAKVVLEMISVMREVKSEG